ncbi:hypothetical protein HDU93_008615 [Gonapodya sp. JEL0774]|nr:hypothetical protein HDU93_008615 [Gonapodya sp. JEL0774]
MVLLHVVILQDGAVLISNPGYKSHHLLQTPVFQSPQFHNFRDRLKVAMEAPGVQTPVRTNLHTAVPDLIDAMAAHQHSAVSMVQRTVQPLIKTVDSLNQHVSCLVQVNNAMLKALGSGIVHLWRHSHQFMQLILMGSKGQAVEEVVFNNHRGNQLQANKTLSFKVSVKRYQL